MILLLEETQGPNDTNKYFSPGQFKVFSRCHSWDFGVSWPTVTLGFITLFGLVTILQSDKCSHRLVVFSADMFLMFLNHKNKKNVHL